MNTKHLSAKILQLSNVLVNARRSSAPSVKKLSGQILDLTAQLAAARNKAKAKNATPCVKTIYTKVKSNPKITMTRLQYEMANRVSLRTGRPLQASSLYVYRSIFRSALKKAA